MCLLRLLILVIRLRRYSTLGIEELTENQKTMGIREQVLDIAKKEGIAVGEKNGFIKGVKKSKTEVVKNLLAADKFSTQEIANFASVTEAFVLEIKKSLK